MSAYSKINLLEVDNSSTSQAGVEARFGRKHLDSRDLGVSLFAYPANFRSPKAHSHKVQEEAYVVVEGSGKVLLDNEVLELKHMDVIRVSPEVTRSFEAGSEGLKLIAIGGPKPEQGDGIMAEPNWPDQK